MKNYANIFGKIQLFVDKQDAEMRDFGGFFVDFHHLCTYAHRKTHRASCETLCVTYMPMCLCGLLVNSAKIRRY